MKGFWKGYGEKGMELARGMPISQEKPPAEFIVFRNRFFKAIMYGMVFAALLPSIASIGGLANSILSLSVISDLVQNVPYFKTICTVPGFTNVLKLWYLVMCCLGIAFLLYVVIFYPYRTLGPMCRRAVRVKDHVFITGGGTLFSFLIYGLMINPSRSCEEGKLVLGHGNLILHAMTTTYIGLSFWGPLVWAFTIGIWTSTVFMLMLLLVRCFSRKG